MESKTQLLYRILCPFILMRASKKETEKAKKNLTKKFPVLLSRHERTGTDPGRLTNDNLDGHSALEPPRDEPVRTTAFGRGLHGGTGES